MSTDPTLAPGVLTDSDLAELLTAVGIESDLVSTPSTESLADLGLDSLALMELIARIKDRFGVDLDADLTLEFTPAAMRSLADSRATVAGDRAGRTS